MQTVGRSSRRNFMVGGAAAAAFLGPLAAAQLVRMPVSPLKMPAPTPLLSEVAQWEALVGASFLIAGEGGKAVATLAAIVRGTVDPKRPATLRYQPFTAYFTMDPRLAPAGQQKYQVTHPSKGVIELFLSRGDNKQGKAVALALFN